jgi:hypothetical protein
MGLQPGGDSEGHATIDHHQFVERADGTVTGLYPSEPARRKPVKYGRAKDDRLLPVDRGERRRQIVEETGPFLDAVGPLQPDHPELQDLPGSFPGLAPSDKRGPAGADPSEIYEAVERQRSKGATFESAFEAVARELNWSHEVVRRHYYAERTRRLAAEG